MSKLLYPELSYKIVGVLFKVHSKLGGSYQEKYYQRAVAIALREEGLAYKKELKTALSYHNESIGKYFLDFLIENKVVLEIKAKPRLVPQDFRQIRSYLKANNLELGIIANFMGDKLEYRRVLNRLSK